uniref:uncharacterized protein n=1 Tax=Pristiophorus japonicus TaxID=55135 RepID=UPI00398EE752
MTSKPQDEALKTKMAAARPRGAALMEQHMDPVPEVQQAEEQREISIGHPAIQSQQEETNLENPLDEESTNAMFQGLGSAADPVQDRMDEGGMDSDTAPILADFPMAQDQEAVERPQKVKEMNEAKILDIEQEPATSDSLKITGVVVGSNSGTSGLQLAGTQSHRTQEQSTMIPTIRDPVPEVQQAEEQREISIGHPASQSQQKETNLDIPLDEESTNAMCEECEAQGERDLGGDQQCPGNKTNTKPRELDPVPEAQKAENPASQSQQERTDLAIPLDEDTTNAMCEECEAQGEQDLGGDQQRPEDKTDTKPSELPRITGPQREVNMILISDEEKENVMRSLTHVQRKAEEKRRRDKERQTLRVQECLSIVRNRTSTLDHPFLHTYGQEHHTGDLHEVKYLNPETERYFQDPRVFEKAETPPFQGTFITQP